MCGFAALFERERSFEPAFLSDMDKDLYHRGPDSGGIVKDTGYALLFRRLAIIDLTHESDQPMNDPTGRYVMVFNGEIYNFKQLRKELISEGEIFYSQGDSEVILRGYIRWGNKIFSRLEGMFAVVIWDKKHKKGVAARDPLGIKPLYVTRTKGLIGFASEMRPLRRLIKTEVDPTALSELLMYRFAAGRKSNLKNIELVPGGVFIEFFPDDARVVETVYCDPLNTLNDQIDMTEDEALNVAREALFQSVESHLQSDTGYAVQLSGGVDSSLITAIASRNHPENLLRSYGVNLEPLPQDERIYRDMVVKSYNVEHYEVPISGEIFSEALPKAIRAMEGPSAHYGCVMLMLLCEKISETDKVVLTGEGADEFFGGYARYGQWKALRNLGIKAKLIPSFLWKYLPRYHGAKRYANHDPAIVSSVYFDFLSLDKIFPDLLRIPGRREEVAEQFDDFRDRMMAVDQASYLSSLLMRQDKMAMSASVEARVPFTHMPLVDVINKIPQKIRVPGGQTKPLLKKISEPLLPRELLYRRKVGLNLPLDDWLRDPNKLEPYVDALVSPDARLVEYADSKSLRTMVDAFRKGKKTDELPPLMNLVNVELWLRSLDDIRFSS